ncbi:MAG: hypothetical protein ACYCOR_01260 [Acidobacteriaceae bacterium]
MELLLNLVWLAASAVLGALLLKSRSRRTGVSADYVHSDSAAWISYLILIAMLLPVISMTDDLQAMVTLTDGEQIARRFETAAPDHSAVHLHAVLFLPVRNGLFAPVPVDMLDTVREFHPSYRWHRHTTQGRAPPVAG